MNWLQKLAQGDPPWTQTWEEFIAFHHTGNISGGYGDEGQGYDLSHYNDALQRDGAYSPGRYPIVTGKQTFNVPRYGEVEVEFRQSGEPVQYVKTEPDADGYPEVVRDERGLATYLSEDEAKAKGLAVTDPTIHMFANGLCIGHVGDSFGATEMFVVREFQGGGIGPFALKMYMENNPKAYRSPLGQMTWQGVDTAKKTWMLFVEDAMQKGENVPEDVVASYQKEQQERESNPPHREVYNIPNFHTKRVQLQSTGPISPEKGFNEDILTQMGVKFWDVETDHVGRAQRWRSDEGGDWDNAYQFIKSLGYEEQGYRTFDLKMDYSGAQGVILPANTQ